MPGSYGAIQRMAGGAVKRVRRAMGVPMKAGVDMGRALVQAHANASAMLEFTENMRPNCAVNMLTATPTVAVAAGATIALVKVTLQQGDYIESITVVHSDQDFLVSSLKMGSHEYVRQGPANMSALLTDLNRVDRPVPMVGRKLSASIDVTATIINPTGDELFFKGIQFNIIDTTCVPLAQFSAPAPHTTGWPRMTGLVRNMVMAMTSPSLGADPPPAIPR